MDGFDSFDVVLFFLYFQLIDTLVTRLTREGRPRIAVDKFDVRFVPPDVDAPAGPLVTIEGRCTGLRHMLRELRGGHHEVVQLTVTQDWVTLRTTDPPADERLT